MTHESPPSGGEVIGWRAWALEEDDAGPLLRSVNYRVAWPGPALTADVAPTERNAHGIYARASEEAAQEYTQTQPVWGEVALSGTVVVGTMGYRAEHAMIRSLYLNPPTRGQNTGAITDGERIALADALAARYAVDVTVLPWPEADRAAWEANRARLAKLHAALANMQAAMRTLEQALDRTSLAVVTLDNQFGQPSLLVTALTEWTVEHRRAAAPDFYTFGFPVIVGPTEQIVRMEGRVIEVVEP